MQQMVKNGIQDGFYAKAEDSILQDLRSYQDF